MTVQALIFSRQEYVRLSLASSDAVEHGLAAASALDVALHCASDVIAIDCGRADAAAHVLRRNVACQGHVSKLLQKAENALKVSE
jgi:hypothetical protein